MYSYKFTDEQTKEIEDKATKMSEIEKKFKEIDNKFEIGTGISQEDYQKSLDLQKKEFENLSPEEIEKRAQAGLHEYKEAETKAIDNSYTANKTALEEQEKHLTESVETSKGNLIDTVDRLKTDASNDALKRGLARSSIIVNKLANYDKALLDEFSKIEKDFVETSQKLAASKSLLEVQRQNALDSFDITYAIKLSEKINGIEEKLADKEREVLEYNNKIQQLEKEFELEQLEKYNKAKESQTDQVMDYVKFVEQGGLEGVRILKEKEKYSAALEHFMLMPKAEALYELETNAFYKQQLQSQYQTLLNAIQSRKE